MKKILCTLVYVVSAAHLQSFFSYEETRMYLQSTSVADAQLILNIAYWSHERSRITQEAQTSAELALQELWITWLSCAERRLDPLAQLSYPIPDGNLPSIQVFQNNAIEHARIRNNYAALIEKFNNATTLSTSSRNYINALRSNSRTLVSNALWNDVSDIKDTLEPLCVSLQEAVSLFHKKNSLPADEHLTKNFITNQLWNLIEGLEVNSFIKLNKEYLHASDALFKTFLASQKVLNNVWSDIETARAEFYYKRYQEIYQALQELHFPSQTFLDIFDKNKQLPLFTKH